MLWMFKINRNMNKEIKLKTKLEFRFNADDLEMPVMDFLSDDPKEKSPEEIRIHQKIKKTRKKNNQYLF